MIYILQENRSAVKPAIVSLREEPFIPGLKATGISGAFL
jgi:hypothetical protein